jgi:hypothetical protein
MAQQDYTSLIVLAGAGALAWYGYQQGWFANLFPAAAAPGATPCAAPNILINNICTAPAAGSTPQVALSANIVNNTSGSASAFRIGDAFTVTVTGPPNSLVTVSGTQNGSAFGPISQGTTNANGVLVITGTMPEQNVGLWVEHWSVGGANAGSISFTVSGGSSNPISTPADLATLLTTAAGSGAQFGLDTDQWAYYYAGLPGRTAATAAQVEMMLTNAGLTDATRSQVEDVNAFVGQLNSVGLTGLGYYPGIPAGLIHGGW